MYCQWIDGMKKVCLFSHYTEPPWEDEGDVCLGIHCTLRLFEGAGVTLFWIGWEHDLSPRHRLTSSADTQIQTIVALLVITSGYERKKVCLITSESVCGITEFFLLCGNPNKSEFDFFVDFILLASNNEPIIFLYTTCIMNLSLKFCQLEKLGIGCNNFQPIG